MNHRIVIAGGSGFTGQILIPSLTAAGFTPVVLTTSNAAVPCARAVWDGIHPGPWEAELNGARALINLSGPSMDCRYTAANRAHLTACRLNPIRALFNACERCPQPPNVWIQAGSAGYYGDAGDAWCDEASPAGGGFPAVLARNIEETFFGHPLAGVRRVLLRMGFILGREGGALTEYAKLVQRGMGAPAGSGRQWISWLHAADFSRIVSRMVLDESATGIYNAVAPQPVTNRDFVHSLCCLLGGLQFPAMPVPIVKLAAWLLGRDSSLALSGRRVRPAALLADGFQFSFPDLDSALRELLPAALAKEMELHSQAERRP